MLRTPTTFSQRLFAWLNNDAFKMLGQVPGPLPSFPFGNALEFTKNEPHELMSQWHAEYGDYMLFWVFGKPSLLINDPRLLEQILISRQDDYHKNVPRGAVLPIMGQSVFTSIGGREAIAKRKSHPFESPDITRWYDRLLRLPGPVTELTIAERLQAPPLADAPANVDLFDLLLHTSVQLFSRAVLGTGLSDGQFQNYLTMWREIGRRGALPVPFSPNPVFWLRRQRWLSFVEGRIDREPEVPAAFDIAARMHSSSLPKRYVRDEVSNVFFAGARNVAITSSMVLYMLSQHPEIGKRVKKELENASTEQGLTLKTLNSLRLLDRVVKETLRMYSVVPGFVREVKPDRAVVLGGHVLPPSTQIFVVPWTLHRHPGLWPEPLKFDPDRFLVEPPPGQYIPFGYGPRSCVGADFTMICAKALIVTFLARYAITMRFEQEVEMAMFSGTAFPRYGLPAQLVPEAPAVRRPQLPMTLHDGAVS